MCRCTDRLDALRNSPEAVSGYTAALAALLGAVHLSPLGVPHCKGKVSIRGPTARARSVSAAPLQGQGQCPRPHCKGKVSIRGPIARARSVSAHCKPQGQGQLPNEKIPVCAKLVECAWCFPSFRWRSSVLWCFHFTCCSSKHTRSRTNKALSAEGLCLVGFAVWRRTSLMDY